MSVEITPAPRAPRRPSPVKLTSTWSRALVPVLAGLVVLAVLSGVLWGIASVVSRNSSQSEVLADRTFEPGPAVRYAELVAADGPILFPDLLGTDGDRTVVLHHEGDDPKQGWLIFLAHPADRPISCKVTQTPGTRTFTDCDGRRLDVLQLSPPPAGVKPVIQGDTLILDLIPD
jgi:hypothetical protein